MYSYKIQVIQNSMFMYTEISMMTTTSSISLVHRILISLNNLTVRIDKTACHFYEMYVILNICKFHIHKFL